MTPPPQAATNFWERLASYAEVGAVVISVGSLVLSIITFYQQDGLSRTQNGLAQQQNRLSEEQNRIAEKQNRIAEEQRKLTARAAAPAVDWYFSESVQPYKTVTLTVTNHDKWSANDVTLAAREGHDADSPIIANYRFGLLEPCSKESVTVPQRILGDKFSFTFYFRDIDGRYWSKYDGYSLGESKKPPLDTKLDKWPPVTVDFGICERG
jgi:hypothetical protein